MTAIARSLDSMTNPRETIRPACSCFVDTERADVDAADGVLRRAVRLDVRRAHAAGGRAALRDGPGRRPGRGGIGAASDGAPAAWNTYVASRARTRSWRRWRPRAARSLLEPFDVGEAGRMAVFADPEGAAFRVWQAGERTAARARQRARARGTGATSRRATSTPRKAFYARGLRLGVPGRRLRPGPVGDDPRPGLRRAPRGARPGHARAPQGGGAPGGLLGRDRLDADPVRPGRPRPLGGHVPSPTPTRPPAAPPSSAARCWSSPSTSRTPHGRDPRPRGRDLHARAVQAARLTGGAPRGRARAADRRVRLAARHAVCRRAASGVGSMGVTLVGFVRRNWLLHPLAEKRENRLAGGLHTVIGRGRGNLEPGFASWRVAALPGSRGRRARQRGFPPESVRRAAPGATGEPPRPLPRRAAQWGSCPPRSHKLTLGLLTVAGISFALMQTLVVPSLPFFVTRVRHVAGVGDVAGDELSGELVGADADHRQARRRARQEEAAGDLARRSSGSRASGAALAPNIGVLIAFRALQGAGAAIFPLSFGIIRDEFPPQKVGVAIGTCQLGVRDRRRRRPGAQRRDRRAPELALAVPDRRDPGARSRPR